MTEQRVFRVVTDCGTLTIRESPFELIPFRDNWVQCRFMEYGKWAVKDEKTGLYKEKVGWKVTHLIQLNLDKII